MFKKNALAVVVAASMIPAAAMADTSVYGQARVFFVNQDDGTNDAWKLQSEASRLGVKGSAELDHELEVVYKYEFQVDPTDGEGGKIKGDVFSARNQYVGLKGNFGQVIFGKNDTPLKKSQGKIDLFSDYTEADMKKAGVAGENRSNNIVYYKSPKIAEAVNIHVAFIPGENAGTNGEDGIADNTSIAATFKQDNLYFALAADDYSNDSSIVRLSGQYKADAFGAGLIYNMSEDSSKDEANSIVVSGYFNATDALKLKLQHVSTQEETSAGVDGDETTQTTFGADYKLGKKTTAVAYFTSRETEDNAGATTDELDQFGLGLIHKF